MAAAAAAAVLLRPNNDPLTPSETAANDRMNGSNGCWSYTQWADRSLVRRCLALSGALSSSALASWPSLPPECPQRPLTHPSTERTNERIITGAKYRLSGRPNETSVFPHFRRDTFIFFGFYGSLYACMCSTSDHGQKDVRLPPPQSSVPAQLLGTHSVNKTEEPDLNVGI